MSETIPVIDFSDYGVDVRDSDVKDDKLENLSTELYQVFTNIGFCYIKNHGISEEMIRRVLHASKQFFIKDRKEKESFIKTGHHTSGWVCLEKESLKPGGPGDLKEIFDFLPVAPLDVEFLRKCHSGIGGRNNTTALRSLFYPAMSTIKDIKLGQTRCGEHTDYGTITLLFQDDTGGLEIRTRNGDYVHAEPKPGTILVNTGVLIQRWTADKFVANMHRVLIPDYNDIRARSRQSLAFFVNPNDEVTIECLDGSDKYEPISGKEYILQRHYATL